MENFSRQKIPFPHGLRVFPSPLKCTVSMRDAGNARDGFANHSIITRMLPSPKTRVSLNLVFAGLRHLMNVPATIVDVEEAVFSSPNPQDFVVDLEYFLEHERRFGLIPEGSVVLVHTGWSRFWPKEQEYFGRRDDGTLNFPGISGNAAKWLVSEKNVVGVGIDSASVDIGNYESIKGHLPVHITLCGNNVYIIENVANLTPLLRRVRPPRPSANTSGSLPLRPCDLRLYVLPIKSRGTGGPARVIAQCA